MRISRAVVASAVALAAMAAVGIASGQAEAPDHTRVVVEDTDQAPQPAHADAARP